MPKPKRTRRISDSAKSRGYSPQGPLDSRLLQLSYENALSGQRLRLNEVRLREFQRRHTKLVRRYNDFVDRLEKGRIASGNFHSKLIKADNSKAVAKISAAAMPYLGSHGMVVLKHDGHWVGYVAPLSKKGAARAKAVDLKDFKPTEHLKMDTLHPSIKAAVKRRITSINKVRIGRDGYLIILNPKSKLMPNELEIRSSRRATVINTKLAALRGRKKAEQAMRDLRLADTFTTMGTLVGGIAHELRKPLGGLVGAGSLLQMELAPVPKGKSLEDHIDSLPDAQKRQILQQAYDSVPGVMDNARSIHNTLNSMSNLLAGKSPAIADINLRNFMGDEVHRFRNDIEDKMPNLEIDNQIPESLPLVRGDGTMLGSVLSNLMRNAAEAMEKQERQHITVKAEVVDKNGAPHVRVSVRDIGPGIPKKNWPKIFNRYSAYSSKKEGGKLGGGMGIGLRLSRILVRAHDGELDFNTKTRGKGRGTTFFFDIPASKK